LRELAGRRKLEKGAWIRAAEGKGRKESGMDDGEPQFNQEDKRIYQSVQTNLHLSVLFSPKQRELIFKKLQKRPFSKTDREYYSRVVKKKLEAMSNNEVIQIARLLTGK
jgi:hypothetical protein